MSQLQNCIVMCTKNGSYCENEKKRKSQGEGGMCTKNGSYCEKAKNRGGGQGRCERRSEAFVKIRKKKTFFFFFFLGGGGGGSGWGGGGSGWM